MVPPYRVGRGEPRARVGAYGAPGSSVEHPLFPVHHLLLPRFIEQHWPRAGRWGRGATARMSIKQHREREEPWGRRTGRER